MHFGPRTVLILLAEKPFSGALDDGQIHRMHAIHVGEFQDAVGGQADIRGRMPEPIEAASGNLECQQALVSVIDELARFDFDFGREPSDRLEIIQRQHVRVGGRRGLLETTVGFPQHPFEALLQIGQRRGEDLHAQDHRTLDPLLR